MGVCLRISYDQVLMLVASCLELQQSHGHATMSCQSGSSELRWDASDGNVFNQDIGKLWLDEVCIDQSDIACDHRCLPVLLTACNSLRQTSKGTDTFRLWCFAELFAYFSMGREVNPLNQDIFLPGCLVHQNRYSLVIKSEKEIVLAAVQQLSAVILLTVASLCLIYSQGLTYNAVWLEGCPSFLVGALLQRSFLN